MLNPEALRTLVLRWKDDPGSTYNSWFLWEDRLKNFRAIRRGLTVVVSEIESGAFGNVYKGSSLETVVGSIAEQRQMFKGADHAFLWKPKLRIPDVYESRENQVAFGRFLDACCCCSTEADILDAIERLDSRRIKGLGPAAANLSVLSSSDARVPFQHCDRQRLQRAHRVECQAWTMVRLPSDAHWSVAPEWYGARFVVQ